MKYGFPPGMGMEPMAVLIGMFKGKEVDTETYIQVAPPDQEETDSEWEQTVNKVTLKAKSVEYGSPGDEKAFFDWLQSLSCVCDVYGKSDVLYIEIDATTVDDDQLYELLSLFDRYRIEMSQLATFHNDDNSHWLNDPTSYWHERVFGDT